MHFKVNIQHRRDNCLYLITTIDYCLLHVYYIFLQVCKNSNFFRIINHYKNRAVCNNSSKTL